MCRTLRMPITTSMFDTSCRLVEVEYAEIEDRKVRSQLQNVGAIERQVRTSVILRLCTLFVAMLFNQQQLCHSLACASGDRFADCIAQEGQQEVADFAAGQKWQHQQGHCQGAWQERLQKHTCHSGDRVAWPSVRAANSAGAVLVCLGIKLMTRH